MRDDTSTPATARPGTSLLSGVIAAVGALSMGASLATLHDLALSSHGHEALIAWVLIGLAGLGTMLCLYLTLIWGLAAAIMLAGPASRIGAALLGLLRVLAPRLARRLASGAAVATAATALTLAPGMAAQISFTTDPAAGRIPITQTAQLFSTERPSTDPAPGAAAPGSSGQEAGGPDLGAPLPPLGWGGGTAPTTTDAAPDVDPGTPDAGDPGSDPSSSTPAPVRTVVVHPGDSLWSISDDLLGPAVSEPAEIAAAWPLLHDANRGAIGENPDLLRPGQELIIPTAMTPQDMP